MKEANMSKIQIDYTQVYSEIPKLKSHISSNITDYANSEYQKIQSTLEDVDGEATACLKEIMEANRHKAHEAASILDELLQFIHDSAKQMEMQEHKIAQTMTAGENNNHNK